MKLLVMRGRRLGTMFKALSEPCGSNSATVSRRLDAGIPKLQRDIILKKATDQEINTYHGKAIGKSSEMQA